MQNLSPGMVDGGDVLDIGPEHDLCSDTVEWQRLTQPEMLTVLSTLDGTYASINLYVKQASQRSGRCAAYACVEPPVGGVRGIGRGLRWCQLHHDLVEILLIVKRGWAQGQDLMAELQRYRQEVIDRRNATDTDLQKAKLAHELKAEADRSRQRRAREKAAAARARKERA